MREFRRKYISLFVNLPVMDSRFIQADGSINVDDNKGKNIVIAYVGD